MASSFATPSRRRGKSIRESYSVFVRTHRREISVAIAIAGLAGVLALAAPGYFARENLIDLFLANIPVLVIALGMTLVILTGQIDISIGSVFAICGVAAGVLAK